MYRGSARLGFTLREMFTVLTAICVLLALLVPAVQSSREAARKRQCENNLKCIVLALHYYHDTHKTFPMGAMHSGPNPGGTPPVTAALGPSWYFGSVPYYCEGHFFELIRKTQSPGTTKNPQFCADDMTAAGVQLSTYHRPWMSCPSSPLPVTETPSGPIALLSYVGIAGGCDVDSSSQDYRVGNAFLPGLPITDRVYQNKAKGTGAAAGGIVTSSGMLPPCEHVAIQDCTDGTANTMMVAEQSGWLLDQNPASSKKYHGDPGWTVGGTGPGGGWLSGTRRVDPVPQVEKPGGPPATWDADCWNITTVRYPPNFKRVMGTTPLPGCSENHGINNPLQSPHPSGLQAAMADGSVRFISDKTSLEVLLRLAIRDDGQPVGGTD